MINLILRDLIFITITLLPLYVVRGSLFSIPTTLLEVFILGTGFIWLLSKVYKKEQILLKSQILIPTVLLLFCALISVFVAPDVNSGLGIFKAYFIEPVLFFFVTLDVCRRLKTTKFVLYALVLSAIWLSFLVVFQVFTGKLVFAPFEFALKRATGVYNSANSLGLYLGPIFSIVLAKLLFDKSKLIEKIVYLICGLLIILAIIFSKSQGSMIAIFAVSFFAGVILITKFKLGKFVKWIAIPILVGTLLFLSSVFILDLTPKVNDYVYSSGNTIQIRLYVWQGTLDLLFDRPLLGAGLSGFKPIYFWHYHLPQYDEALQYPHNIFLNFYTELGLLGLITFSWIFIKLSQIALRSGKNLPLSRGIFLALIYILIHGLVDVPYFKNDLAVEFWVIAAVLIASADSKISDG